LIIYLLFKFTIPFILIFGKILLDDLDICATGVLFDFGVASLCGGTSGVRTKELVRETINEV
jgi:hypothetical protein